MLRREQRTVDSRPALTQRGRRAREAARFADAYAERCGLIPMELLLELYQETFPDSRMSYGHLRCAAAGRDAGSFGTCGIWEQAGCEYALAASLSNAGHNERFFNEVKNASSGNSDWYRFYQDELPHQIRLLRHAREELAGFHGQLPVRMLDIDELAQGHLGFIRHSDAMNELSSVLIGEFVRNAGPYAEAPDRRYLVRSAAKICYGLTMLTVGLEDAVQDYARRLVPLTLPDDSHDRTQDDEPLPSELVHAVERLYNELPLWSLNGWSARELRVGAVQLATRVRL